MFPNRGIESRSGPTSSSRQRGTGWSPKPGVVRADSNPDRVIRSANKPVQTLDSPYQLQFGCSDCIPCWQSRALRQPICAASQQGWASMPTKIACMPSSVASRAFWSANWLVDRDFWSLYQIDKMYQIDKSCCLFFYKFATVFTKF